MSTSNPAAQHEATLSHLEQMWTAAVLSTAPADRPAAEAAVETVYRALGFAPPRRIDWANGPLELSTLRERSWQSETVGANMMPVISDKLAHANCTFSESVRQHPLHQRRHLLVDSHSGLRLAVTTLVDQETARVTTGWRIRRLASWLMGTRQPTQWRTLGTGGRSQFDALYLCSQNHLYDSFGLLSEHAALLQALATVATSAGWMVPHQHVCWLSERPDALRVDARGRLHASDGPALLYRDGWEVHAWKGVRVPPWVLERADALTVSTVDRESDPFVRRCMIEIMTPARYIAAGGARVAARDETGTLWQKSWAFDAWAAVEVVNGTPEPDGTYKHYFLQVPPEMQSARQAVAWTYDLSESEYARLAVRT